ncbi:MAG: isopentenyl-diphosphate Delta-isomerase [Hyphomonas sp.]
MTDEFEQVILVDEADAALGEGDKWQIHRDGLLHRAFSIFVFNARGECLIQQRAAGKYHSAGLWANSCCGHPRPGETTSSAAARRLEEEVGLRVDLTFGFKSRYVAHLDNNMTENEIPYLYFGWTQDKAVLNPDEVQAVRWRSLERLAEDVVAAPEAHAAWLKHYLTAHTEDLAAWRDRALGARISEDSLPWRGT